MHNRLASCVGEGSEAHEPVWFAHYCPGHYQHAGNIKQAFCVSGCQPASQEQRVTPEFFLGHSDEELDQSLQVQATSLSCSVSST